MKAINLIFALFAIFTLPLCAADYSSKEGAIEVNESSFDSVILKSTKPVVVSISAVWCKPCQQMKPIFNDLAKTLGDKYLFAHVDYDQNQGLAQRYSIQSLPTTLFFKDGQLITSKTGAMTSAELDSLIKSKL